MFDVGFSELLLIGLVALVVIGPKDLPRVARTVGLLLGRLQRHVAEVKADINREIQLDEMKRLRTQISDSAHELQQSLQSQASDIASAFQPTVETVEDLKTSVLSAGESETVSSQKTAEVPVGGEPSSAVIDPAQVRAEKQMAAVEQVETVAVVPEAAPVLTVAEKTEVEPVTEAPQLDLFGSPIPSSPTSTGTTKHG